MEAATAAIGNGVERYPRRWLAALVMIGAATMDLIDLTIVNLFLGASLLALALPKTAVDPSAVFVADVDSEVAER